MPSSCMHVHELDRSFRGNLLLLPQAHGILDMIAHWNFIIVSQYVKCWSQCQSKLFLTFTNKCIKAAIITVTVNNNWSRRMAAPSISTATPGTKEVSN